MRSCQTPLSAVSGKKLRAGQTDLVADDSDIDQAMSGNICRCGTYPRIRAAIHTAAKGA